jgi:asparagine synthase (glutamine-hydrolysing)
MSVQAGIWNLDGTPINRELLANLSQSLKLLGPDGESMYVDASFGVLYRPFHTTGESRRESQPHLSNKGKLFTWDGRLDNRDELIAELGTGLQVEPTDVGIVSAAFDRWGAEGLRRIVGDWALCIWDPGHRELILAIDYMAIRHLFYYVTNVGIWWSTDLAPLVLLSGDKFHVQDEYIAGYFAGDPDAHLTPYREIQAVPPGHFVRVRNGRVLTERYWRFDPKVRIRYKTDAEYEEHFRHVFRQAVRRRLRSDAPVLAELSGGLDSSSIVCMADDIAIQERAQLPRLDTLSYYDKTEPRGDDWVYFQKVEEKRGRSGIHIDASKLGSAPSSFEYREFVPLPGYFGAGRHLEAQRAAAVQDAGYKVVLSGIGGDEFMGGNPDPRLHLADLIVQFKVILLFKQLLAWSLVKRTPWIHLLWQSSVELLPSSLGQHLLKEAKVEAWLDAAFAKRTRLGIRQLGPTETFGAWLPTRRSYIGAVLAMANKMAQYGSRSLALEETRYPYLDRDLIEFILSIPASQLLRPGQRRSLMRRSLIGIVPQEILERSTKQYGARTPVIALQNNWAELRAAFESGLCSKLGYINTPKLMETVQDAINGKTVHIGRLLKAISLEFWLRTLTTRDLVDLRPAFADKEQTVNVRQRVPIAS